MNGDWIETPPLHIVLRDTTFLGTATKNDFGFSRTTDTLTYEWGLNVLVRDNGLSSGVFATVTIVNNEGTTVYSGPQTVDGILPTQYLQEWIATTGVITNQYTPHNVTVNYGNETISKMVTMDSSKTEVFDFYSTGNSPDVNSDGVVNIIDLAIVIFNQGRAVDGSGYDHLDIDGDGDIDWADVQLVASYI